MRAMQDLESSILALCPIRFPQAICGDLGQQSGANGGSPTDWALKLDTMHRLIRQAEQ
jgi:hypothetical protein